MAKQVHIGIRADQELKDALKALADAQRRKLSDYVHEALMQHVAGQRSNTPSPEPKRKK